MSKNIDYYTVGTEMSPCICDVLSETGYGQNFSGIVDLIGET
ncbi:hypothetical protein [Vibrio salinus]|nr:hypothetical protein [Vibrio salinus]